MYDENDTKLHVIQGLDARFRPPKYSFKGDIRVPHPGKTSNSNAKPGEPVS